jgi:ribosome-binding factor A
MSQRVPKVESVVQQVVASALVELLERDAAAVTVTRVDAAPDLHNATVWIGLLGNDNEQDRLWQRVEELRGDLQGRLAAQMTTKYVPRLHLRRDNGGEYAANIERLLRNL